MLRTPYHITALIAAWALTAFTVMMAVWGAPPGLPARGVIWWFFPALYVAAALAAYMFADLLDDFLRQLDLREKFAYCLVHALLFIGHMPMLRGFWIEWGAAVIFLPLILFLQREIAFNRLALACGALWMARLSRLPGDPPWWTLLFAALLLVMLIASRHFTAYRRFGVERGERARYFWRMAGLWCAGLAAFGGVAWLLLPRLRPVRFSEPPAWEVPYAEGTPVNAPIDLPFIIDVLFWTASLLGILYAIYYIRAKMARGGKVPFAIARATLQRVSEEVGQRIIQRWRANLMNPADRVIFEYNLFCDAMGRFDLARQPAMTPGEYRIFLTGRLADAATADDLDYLTELFQRALYGADDISSVDSRMFQHITQTLIALLENRFGLTSARSGGAADHRADDDESEVGD